MSIARGGSQEGWERGDFPIVCETCLGPNPYLRMMKAEFDKECKICTRPFTVFRWRPGTEARYKKTEICQTCSKIKNVCQTCLLDLEYGLPVQVRDVANTGSIPQSDVNREWFAEQAERQLASGQIGNLTTTGRQETRNQMLKLARSAPYYKRNEAHICSFFVKGNCNRGTNCPYRHELPEKESDLANQNIKDRYHGINDPVARKLLGKVGAGCLIAPQDTEIKTLWVGGVDSSITEQDLRDVFYAYGELKEIKLTPQSMCAFVTYTTREAAELATQKLYLNLRIKDHNLKLAWGKPQNIEKTNSSGYFTLPTSGPISYMPPPNPSISKPYYSSMDPSSFGSKRDR
jgi:pre-mRNA-splicing factor RBM22/SLT11